MKQFSVAFINLRWCHRQQSEQLRSVTLTMDNSEELSCAARSSSDIRNLREDIPVCLNGLLVIDLSVHKKKKI